VKHSQGASGCPLLSLANTLNWIDFSVRENMVVEEEEERQQQQIGEDADALNSSVDSGIHAHLDGDVEVIDGHEDDHEDESLEDPLAHLPDFVLRRVDKLRDLDIKRSEIVLEYLRERAELEKKYAGLFNPLYEERSRVVQGELDEEIAEAKEDGQNGNTHGTVSEDEGNGERVKGIPQFWVCSMSNNETVGELITEDDVDCLEHLTDVKCVDREDGKGFQLLFHFATNEYFENSVLTKTYDVPNLLLSDEPLLKHVSGTEIKWKSGRALTFRMIKKKQRGKGKNAGQIRTVEKKEELDSFFRWFEPPEMPSMDSMNEEEAEHLEEVFDADYEVAQAFRCHIIPRAILWFSGHVSNMCRLSFVEIEPAQGGIYILAPLSHTFSSLSRLTGGRRPARSSSRGTGPSRVRLVLQVIWVPTSTHTRDDLPKCFFFR